MAELPQTHAFRSKLFTCCAIVSTLCFFALNAVFRWILSQDDLQMVMQWTIPLINARVTVIGIVIFKFATSYCNKACKLNKLARPILMGSFLTVMLLGSLCVEALRRCCASECITSGQLLRSCVWFVVCTILSVQYLTPPSNPLPHPTTLTKSKRDEGVEGESESEHNEKRARLFRSINVATVTAIAYVLTALNVIDYHESVVLHSVVCIILRSNSFCSKILLRSCIVFALSLQYDMNAGDIHSSFPLGLYMALLIDLFGRCINEQSIRHSADGRRLHFLYQHAFYFAAISITALCRIQSIWMGVAVESLQTECAVALVSAAVVMSQLNAQLGPSPFDKDLQHNLVNDVMMYAMGSTFPLWANIEGYERLNVVVLKAKYLSVLCVIMVCKVTLQYMYASIQNPSSIRTDVMREIEEEKARPFEFEAQCFEMN